jgi:hypothetical protein
LVKVFLNAELFFWKSTCLPEGDLELFVGHLSLPHQAVVQELLHDVRGYVYDGGLALEVNKNGQNFTGILSTWDRYVCTIPFVPYLRGNKVN